MGRYDILLNKPKPSSPAANQQETQPPQPQQKPSKPLPPSPSPKSSKQVVKQDSQYASKPASMLANNTDAVIETIRKTVKQVGKETTFMRLTPDEKKQLRAIDYTYKSQGIKTSENEIGRIGINFLLEDYKAHGKASILARVLAALNA